MTRLLLLALGGLAAGCIQTVAPPGDRTECTVDAECRTGEGEICDDGVCWGDPPMADYAAVLGPAAAYNSIAATTEVSALTFTPDGWFRDLTLAHALRVSGQVRAACPAVLDQCTGLLVVPGKIQWSRPSSVDGLPDISVTTQMTANNGTGSGSGFEVFLPRPVAPTTYTVSFSPSTVPLGVGLPSPASLLPPFQATVVVSPADKDGLVRDFMLPTSVRTLSGRISQVGATTLAGWRVHAEAGDGTVLGALALASNVATTGAQGDFTLALAEGPSVVDLVFVPSNVPGVENEPPRVRLRDHVVTSPLTTIILPKLERIVAVPVQVDGLDGAGQLTAISGAIVVGRLDQQIGAVSLQHQATTTTAGGLGSIQLLLGTANQPLEYELDILPGPTSEMASIYGVDLDIADTVPAPRVRLQRGESEVGAVLDEAGFGVAGATVTASVSGAALCELSSDDLRVARGLAPVQATTDDNGEFTLFLDPDFDGTTLTYDITVEPAAGTWAPRWTFQALELTGEHRQLWLPAAAHVRSLVHDPLATPAPDTLVTLYELTDKPPPCPAVALGKAGLAVRRAVATSDADGIVRVILPRVPVQQ